MKQRISYGGRSIALYQVRERSTLPTMRGHVSLRGWKRGKLLWEREIDNLVVTSHGTPTAHLLGGDAANNSINAIGFGSGSNVPAIGDAALTAPAYYKAIPGGSITYPSAGQVQFAFTLVAGTDTGAYGINIGELGLFCNTTSVALPGATSPATLFARVQFPFGTFSATSVNISGSWLITA